MTHGFEVISSGCGLRPTCEIGCQPLKSRNGKTAIDSSEGTVKADLMFVGRSDQYVVRSHRPGDVFELVFASILDAKSPTGLVHTPSRNRHKSNAG
jgi:hypothetical protein